MPNVTSINAGKPKPAQSLNYDHEAAYDFFIAPKLAELQALCIKHGISLDAYCTYTREFQRTEDGELDPSTEVSGVAFTSALSAGTASHVKLSKFITAAVTKKGESKGKSSPAELAVVVMAASSAVVAFNKELIAADKAAHQDKFNA